MYVKCVKVVFAAYTQHCIQSNGTHVGGVESVLYSVYRATYQFQREGYLKSLQSCGFSGSNSEEAAFVNFLGLVKLQG